MAIKINAGFHIGAPVAIDDRLFLTKEQMLAIDDNIYPQYAVITCADDGGLYIYDKSAEPNVVTGKCKSFSSSVTIQLETMPTASADNVGKVYQYIGETTETFEKGYWYVCKSDGAEEPTYSWNNILVQPIDCQFKTMPTASADLVGKVYQYVGTTDTDFTKGFFYECVRVDYYYNGSEVFFLTESPKVGLTAYGNDTCTEVEGTITSVTDTYFEVDNREHSRQDLTPTTEGENYIWKVIQTSKDESVITEEIIATEEVGGVNPNDVFANGTDVTELLKKILVKYYAPLATISAIYTVTNGDSKKTDNGLLVEKGATVKITKLTAEITKKSADIATVEFTAISGLTNGAVTTEVKNGGTFNTSDDTSAVISDITSDNIYTVKATDVTDNVKNVGKASINFIFAKKYYVGASDTDTEIDLTKLTSLLEQSGDKTISVTANNQFVVFVQPNEYYAIKSIKDANGFENIDSFHVDTSVEGYRIYISDTKVTCANFNYTFSEGDSATGIREIKGAVVEDENLIIGDDSNIEIDPDDVEEDD